MIFLYWLLQLSWGILQTALGFALFLCNVNGKHYLYRGAVVTEWKGHGGISLGLFVFVTKMTYGKDGKSDERSEELLTHEYGHTVQSLILGPLYLLIIGLPSILWASLPHFKRKRRSEGISYYSLYTERWANILAKKITHTQTLDKYLRKRL